MNIDLAHEIKNAALVYVAGKVRVYYRDWAERGFITINGDMAETFTCRLHATQFADMAAQGLTTIG